MVDYYSYSNAKALSFLIFGEGIVQQQTDTINHKWIFRPGFVSLADNLAGPFVPGASGNYLFTKASWLRAGGYPEFSGALDAWGFGLRQLATGSKLYVKKTLFYYHRYGHQSYWVREASRGNISLKALQILIPFLPMIADKDVNYIFGRGRYKWFEEIDQHPIRLKNGEIGQIVGITTAPAAKPAPSTFRDQFMIFLQRVMRKLRRGASKLRRLFFVNLLKR